MKYINFLAFLFILLILIVYCFSIYTTKQFFPVYFGDTASYIISKVIDCISKIGNFSQTSSKPTLAENIVENTVSITGFILTALGFIFVVFQVTALAKQVNKQEEQYHKDSEFKNFLEATKMLTSAENENNTIAQISAMFLLYDFAKKYPKNNLEKVIKVLNKYATPAIYNSKTLIHTSKPNNLKIVSDRKIINEWREYGEPYQRVASTALELNKKLFVYALEHKIKINLSDVIIFDLDIEKDFDDTLRLFTFLFKQFKLFEITKHSPRVTFLCCNFATRCFEKEINFSTNFLSLLLQRFLESIRFFKKSVKGRMDISLSYFINCNLTGCDFYHSNLWGVTFNSCILTDTLFHNAECVGSEFINNFISESQLKSMLFISKDIFLSFRPNLKYGVVLYPLNESYFSNKDEYEKFVALSESCFNSSADYERFVIHQKEQNDKIKSKNFCTRIQNFFRQKIPPQSWRF